MSSSSRSGEAPPLLVTLQARKTAEELAADLASPVNSDEALIDLVREMDLAVGRWDFTIKLSVALLNLIVQYAEEEEDQEMAQRVVALRDELINS